MTKPTRQVTLAMQESDSTLEVLQRLVAEKLHEEDRKDIDKLIDKARNAIVRASYELSNARHEAETALDRI